MHLLKQALFAVVSATLASADEFILKTTMGVGSGAPEFWSCQTGMDSLTYDYEPLMLNEYSVYYDSICGYPPATGGILLCVHELAVDNSPAFMKTLFKYAAEACGKYSSYNESWTYYSDQFDNATAHYTPFDTIENITLPIYTNTPPNITAITPEYIAYRNYYFNLDSGTWFSVGICSYFLFLIVLSAIHNFARHTTISKSVNNSKLVKQIQSKLIFPTLLTNGKFSDIAGSKYFSMLVPNRIQFVTDLFLFILQMIFYTISYRQNEGWWFGSAKHTWQRFLGDRTGIMAFGKIPLLVLFAGRNNFLLTITGWSYSTFLHFHKSLAYWMALDALIHSIAYTCYSLGDYTASLKETYFACGIAATVICFVMIAGAFHPIRRFYYEYFLTMHVLFALGFVIMCWYHCNILGWMEWMIATCAVWFFDRLVRVIRSAAFGWRSAKITVVGDELLKVTVAKPNWWFHKPGTYAYIYFAGWIFWENHPFTTVVEGDSICAYIKVKKGVTYRVWNAVVANGGEMNWKINIEGPYGGELAGGVRKFDEALLIAGGSGVPGILEHAGSVSAGKLVWVTQKLSLVRAYAGLLQNINIDVEVYVTRESGADKSCSLAELLTESGSSSEDEKKSVDVDHQKTGQVVIKYSRPNVWELVDENVRNAASNNVAIVACGPPRLMDELRHVISDRVTSWDKSIDFFDEFQTW